MRAHDPPQPAELRADLLLPRLVEHGDRVGAVDEHKSTELLGVLCRVSHPDRGAVGPSSDDRAFDPGRVDDPSEVVDRPLYGVVGRCARLASCPRVESDRPISPRQALDDAVPVPHGAEATTEEKQGRLSPRCIDGVELGVRDRDRQLSGHGGRALALLIEGEAPTGIEPV
jgi:hypothetical protein